MQFSVVSVIALAAAASASFVPRQGNVTVPYPTGTGVVPSGTGAPTAPASTTIPFTGAAPYATNFAGSVGALALAGGVALFI